MIQQADIENLSKIYQINEYVVAREYFQILFLKELYSENFSKNVFFKGGTAIRLIYGGHRFSEDLDFTCIETEGFEEKIINLFKRLKKEYAIDFKEKQTLTGKTYLLQGNLTYLNSPIFVRTDFSMRENVLEPTNQVLSTEYPVIVQDFIRVLSKNEILSEKVRAIIKRKKHRDIYDLWVLLELGAKLDEKLVKKKLEYYGETFSKKSLTIELKKFKKEEFVKDLSPLVNIEDRKKLKDLFDYVKKYLVKNIS
ncbi:hypothetical protein COV24_02745 [candidate division WWE3 bacterium CG10_big_fil_rev_8_21_14_0_10_32_10]|uniref:Nucleotidyl transferase AbiEii/AbiGii toxin family protein n=1 Tax=candidate division WWE3 bacterium CG10_big_fil_rev_8_21_14_0_10_32_10 TaxID=1975090 RepID=A0A2H0RBN1_UNCKA|nr:MAG: hypothetical protein COV24_02745 [candidate division WWE3 bacterium CG10_big_fil_rev_8_21_14_0_10_32_10]